MLAEFSVAHFVLMLLPHVAMALFLVCHLTITTSTSTTSRTGRYVYKCQGSSCHYDVVCVSVRNSTNRLTVHEQGIKVVFFL